MHLSFNSRSCLDESSVESPRIILCSLDQNPSQSSFPSLPWREANSEAKMPPSIAPNNTQECWGVCWLLHLLDELGHLLVSYLQVSSIFYSKKGDAVPQDSNLCSFHFLQNSIIFTSKEEILSRE